MGIFGGTKRPLRTDLTGQTCLVTGATNGHGRAMVSLLVARGAELVLDVRNAAKARTVQAEIARENGGKTPEILLADLASADAIDSAIESG